MPHVIVKLVAGRTEDRKQALAWAVTEAVDATLGCGQDAVSVALEEVPAAEWMQRVYEREIAPEIDRLYKKPGYGGVP